MTEDLKFAFRRLWLAPGFTAVAVLTLALAIGANTAIFSIADAVLFRPLPYDEPDRVFVLRKVDLTTGAHSSGVAYEFVRALRGHSGVAAVGLRGPTTMMTHSMNGSTEWMETFAVSPEYLPALGVRPALGRVFTAEDAADGGPVAMLSYESWKRRFGGDPNVVGRQVPLGATSRTVVGVLPRNFVFPSWSPRFIYTLTGRPEFITVARAPATGAEPRNGLVVANRTGDAIVRLRDGVSVAQAQAELDVLASSARSASQKDASRPVLDDPRMLLFPAGRPVLKLMVSAAAFVLLIGCANLANMLMARSRRREREIGIRAALGATPLRVVRPIFFEGLIIGALASALALLVTSLTFDLLVRQVPDAVFGSATVGVDLRVTSFTLLLGVLSGVFFTVAPAWRAARLDVQPLVQAGRHGSSRMTFGRPLIIGQVALAIVLLSGAIVAGRTFVSVLQVPLGFDPDNVITVSVQPDVSDERQWQQFYIRAVEALAAHDGVIAAGASRAIPLVLPGANESVEAGGGGGVASVVHVLPGFFDAARIPLIRGRHLTMEDVRSRADVGVVAESTAAGLPGGVDPLGATLITESGRHIQIVGVVADVRMSLDRAIRPPLYVAPGERMGRLTLLVRVRARSPQLLDEIRSEVARMAPGAPVLAVWWSDTIDALAPYRNPRFQALVLGGFGLLALGLTALGIFAVVAFLVTTRTREMGVRLALGARPAALVRLVVRQSLFPVAAGAAVGVGATYWLRGIAASQLVAVEVDEPLLVASAVVAVLLAAALAAYLPARQVSRVDPSITLRAD